MVVWLLGSWVEVKGVGRGILNELLQDNWMKVGMVQGSWKLVGEWLGVRGDGRYAIGDDWWRLGVLEWVYLMKCLGARVDGRYCQESSRNWCVGG